VRWNIKPRTRKEVIEVKEILRQWPEHAADFPGMRIRDQNGREHEFSSLDIRLGLSKEWDDIQVGSKIELTLEETVAEARLLPRNT